MSGAVSVLVVDDSEDDCLLAVQELEQAGFQVEWRRVQDYPGLRSALMEREWSVVLLDHALPGFSGPKALSLVREAAPHTIPIVVSGSIGEDLAVDAIRRGASDYVLKDRLRRLPLAVARELALAGERRARAEAESRIRDLARRDPVTGLPNRIVLAEAISTRVEVATPVGEPFAVIVVELERVQVLQQAFGHVIVEDLLRRVAERLSRVHPAGATLTALGTHEFGLMVESAGPTIALQVGERLRAALDEPVELGGVPIQAEATIGVALYPDHGTHPSILMRHACAAVQIARETGCGIATFRPERSSNASTQLILLGELRGAIQRHEIALEYQPILEMKSGSIASAEALVRWDHPLLGRIQPGSFVPMAESCTLIQPLTREILAQATAWNAATAQDGLRLGVAVNFSTRDLLDPNIVATVEASLSSAGLPPELLEIEITEGSLMVEPQRARTVLEAFRSLGIRLAIDDFGTGYSSFGYLRDLPVHKLKIDRSFVSRVLESRSDAAIVRGIIDLGHTLDLVIIAEGVEDELTMDLLGAFGCDLVQGYHIARPMGGAALREWLKLRATTPADTGTACR